MNLVSWVWQLTQLITFHSSYVTFLFLRHVQYRKMFLCSQHRRGNIFSVSHSHKPANWNNIPEQTEAVCNFSAGKSSKQITDQETTSQETLWDFFIHHRCWLNTEQHNLTGSAVENPSETLKERSDADKKNPVGFKVAQQQKLLQLLLICSTSTIKASVRHNNTWRVTSEPQRGQSEQLSRGAVSPDSEQQLLYTWKLLTDRWGATGWGHAPSRSTCWLSLKFSHENEIFQNFCLVLVKFWWLLQQFYICIKCFKS